MLITKGDTVCDGEYASHSLHGQKRCKFQLNCYSYFYRRQFLYTISKCYGNDDDSFTYPIDRFAILL